MEEGIVHCEEHGETTACFMCQHLSRSLHSRTGGLGFVVSETAGAPQAWCFECDSLLESRGGEWDTTGASFAGVTLACAGCFERMRVLNTRQRVKAGGRHPRTLAQATAPPLDPAEGMID